MRYCPLNHNTDTPLSILISLSPFLQVYFIHLCFEIIPAPKVGLELTTPRSRVADRAIWHRNILPVNSCLVISKTCTHDSQLEDDATFLRDITLTNTSLPQGLIDAWTLPFLYQTVTFCISSSLTLKMMHCGGVQWAQSVEHMTLDLRVKFEPDAGCRDDFNK